MSDEKPKSAEPIDLDQLRQLMELMEQHGLSEVNLRSRGAHVHLKRAVAEPMPMFAAPPMHAYPPPMAGAPRPAGAPAAPAPAAAASEPELPAIKSPIVGTFYAAPSPEDPPFVTVGSRVSTDTTVCVIEAMKVFNQIPAELSGEIVAILVKNGDPVEFGQPLFRIKP